MMIPIIKINIFRLNFNFVFSISWHNCSCIYFLLLSQKQTQKEQELKELIKDYKCITKIELLPFKKICEVKYDNLNLEFPFKDKEEPSNDLMNELNKLL